MGSFPPQTFVSGWRPNYCWAEQQTSHFCFIYCCHCLCISLPCSPSSWMIALIRGYECIDIMSTFTCLQKWADCMFCQEWRVPVSACLYLALIVGIAIIAACVKRAHPSLRGMRPVHKSKIHIDWPKIRHLWLGWEDCFNLCYIVCPTATPLNLKQPPSVHS